MTRVETKETLSIDPVTLADEPRRVHVASLAPVSEALGADKSPREILQLILKAAFSITRASSASLMLIDSDSETLRVEVAEGFRGKRIFNTRLSIGQGVTGWVAETGVALCLGNVRKDKRYVRVRSDLRSELAVPLKIGGKVIGVISCDSIKLNHFTSEDEALLSSLAAQTARVIHSTQLYEETRKRAEELELLSEVSRGLSSTLDMRKVLAQAVEQTAKVCRAAVVSVFLISDGGLHLDMAACHGGSEQYRQQPSILLNGSFLGKVINSGKPALFKDVHNTNGSVRYFIRPEGAASEAPAAPTNAITGEIYIDPTVSSLLAVQLISKDKPLGILCVQGATGRVFDSHDQRLLESLARSAALAIDNARAHRRMLAAEERLRSSEKNSMLGELAAGLAHEIRNPLTSIKVLFGTLLKDIKVHPEAHKDAEMINKQIARLEAIVEGFLNQARAQVMPNQSTRVDLNATVDESMLLAASSANEGTRISIELCDGELPVNGDATQLSQIVYNLVLNAIQAIDRRGRITVSTGRIAKSDGQPPEVYLEVSDDGPGIAEKVMLKLFQPFVTTKKSGVGLGLSIVKRIVESHGGRLLVESPVKTLGRGALFRAVLPHG